MSSIGYKVCGEHLIGIHKIEYVSMYRDFGRTVYHTQDAWTVPNRGCGPLTLFEHKEHALRMAKIYEDVDWWIHPCSVFECEYKPSNERKVWATEFISWGADMTPLSELEAGTILADKVKLLSCIGREEGRGVSVLI